MKDYKKRFQRKKLPKDENLRRQGKVVVVERWSRSGKYTIERIEVMRDQIIPLIELTGRAKSGYKPEYDDYLVDLRIKCQKREGELPKGDLDLALKALSLTPDNNCWDIKERIWKVLGISERPINLRDERKPIIERNFNNAADIPILAKREGKLLLNALNLDVLTTGQVETEKALLARILREAQINAQTGQKHKDKDVIDDLKDHQKDYDRLSETEKDSIIKARIGQGIFRQQLIQLWGGCSVTGLKNEKLLKASHIKPWRDSSNQERLDRHNGLLLVPNLDTLFDTGYITFSETGSIIISRFLALDDQTNLHLHPSMHLRLLNKQCLKYLAYHQDNIFFAE